MGADIQLHWEALVIQMQHRTVPTVTQQYITGPCFIPEAVQGTSMRLVIDVTPIKSEIWTVHSGSGAAQAIHTGAAMVVQGLGDSSDSGFRPMRPPQ